MDSKSLNNLQRRADELGVNRSVALRYTLRRLRFDQPEEPEPGDPGPPA